ncbi:tyrosine-sulfated glycopeptide receptor 1-like [Panicum miliaceum]|uniref:Tyrosine-sulfated glycopeptide receptor 1-like n=1 Tax=Panicum miliaceum TaxID=4540 RepID=A0A3L6RKI0_PANMI|nr:tyrosine-sulfated glycopeptide receptor 1-like [Panicum miliaceum]
MAVWQRPMQLNLRVIVSGVVLLISLLILCDRAGACTAEEREALLSFLADLSPRPGDGIAASWRGSPDCCAWEGVSCGGDGAVTRVWMPRRGLGGMISPMFTFLTALTHLNLSGRRQRLRRRVPVGLALAAKCRRRRREIIKRDLTGTCCVLFLHRAGKGYKQQAGASDKLIVAAAIDTVYEL